MDRSQVKVVLTEDGRVETLWADPLGGDLYRLDNLPFWKYGVSLHDVVEARPDDSGRPAFIRVVEKSGNRTVRIILRPRANESPESQAVLDRLVALGCSYESMNPGYAVVNIPPGVILGDVVEVLTASRHQWEHVDPTYEDLYPNGGALSGRGDR